MKFLRVFIKSLALLLMYNSSFAASVKVIPDNKSALQARVDFIKSAKEEILIEYFEVDDDTVSQMGLALLQEAAEKRGVKVKIIVDNMHSELSKAHFSAVLGHLQPLTRSQNIEIKVFNPLDITKPLDQTYRNHDKLFVVDGRYAIVGGRNVSGAYFGQAENGKANLRDVDVIIDGPETQQARQYFMTLWTQNKHVKNRELYEYSIESLQENCGFKIDRMEDCLRIQKEALRNTQKTQNRLARLLKAIDRDRDLNETSEQTLARMFAGAHHVDLKFLFNDPTQVMAKVKDKLSSQLYRELEELKPESVSIVTPYLFPTNEALHLMEKLSKENGTSIQITTNSLKSTDSTLVHAAYLSVKPRMVKMGMDLFEYNGPFTDSDGNDSEILHAKILVVNENTPTPVLFIGSFNMDHRSALINRELGVKISGRDVKALQMELGIHISDILSQSTKVAEKGREIPEANLKLMEQTPLWKVKKMESEVPLVKPLRKHI